MAALPAKPFFAGALARENITLETCGAHHTTIASLAPLLRVQAPECLFTLLTLRTLSMRWAETLSRIGVTVILSMSTVARCTAAILECIEAVQTLVTLFSRYTWYTVTLAFLRAVVRYGAFHAAVTGYTAKSRVQPIIARQALVTLLSCHLRFAVT